MIQKKIEASKVVFRRVFFSNAKTLLFLRFVDSAHTRDSCFDCLKRSGSFLQGNVLRQVPQSLENDRERSFVSLPCQNRLGHEQVWYPFEPRVCCLCCWKLMDFVVKVGYEDLMCCQGPLQFVSPRVLLHQKVGSLYYSVIVPCLFLVCHL